MNANNLFKAVMELDLDPIKVKLMHVESGEGWSQEKTDAVEKEYRRFLCLMKMYPQEDTAPLVDVDTFWHYHILDTMKYAVDCEQAFGYFLHHYPYVGLRGGDDEQFRLDSGDRMRTLYEATFGEAYPGSRAEMPADADVTWPGLPALTGRGARADMAFCAGPGIQAAFCAGPGSKTAARGNAAGTAFCAGPGAKTAFCAGPGAKAAFRAGPDAKTAFCAGPGVKAAFCAGPGAKTAFCAGPGVKAAFCAGPGVKAAFCAGPGKKLLGRTAAANAATAFCAGPGAKAAVLDKGAATAFCAGPGSENGRGYASTPLHDALAA